MMAMRGRFALGGIAVLAVLAGCATSSPPPAQVVTLKANSLPPEPGLPPAGTTWRLDSNELQSLSPAPYIPPPPLMLPYPVPGVAPPPPPPYAPYAYGLPPIFYFGLGYGWGGHRHWPGMSSPSFHPRRR